MNRFLIVTMDEASDSFVYTLRKLGGFCTYLDFCVSTSEFLRNRPSDVPVIKAHNKTAVLNNSEIRTFDTAVVFEGAWLESALIVQALKQAGVGKVVVVAQNQSYMRAYRALGADRVVGMRRWQRDSMRVLGA